MELEPAQPTVIYWVVPCPECAAPALTPCLEEGRVMDGDIHLIRAELFASVRFQFPQWHLSDLMGLSTGEYQPRNPESV